MKFFFLFIFINLFCGNKISNAQQLSKKIFDVNKKITLENILGSIPLLYVDVNENIIGTQTQQGTIKIFDNNGNLIHTYGKKGRGPGDFMYPTSTIRLNSGNLLTADFLGKLSLFNPTGDSLIRVYKIKLMPITQLKQINDKKVVIVGRNRAAKKPKLLHIFNLSKGTITKSFLDSPFLIQENKYAGIFSTFANLATIDVKDGKIAVMLVPFPSIKIYTDEGIYIKTIDLSLKNFKRVKKIDKSHLTTEEFNTYLTTFSVINNIFWLNDNSFLLDYYRFIKYSRSGNRKTIHHLVKISANGHVIFELKNTPRLTGAKRGYLYFSDPNLKDEVDLLKATIINQ